MINRLLQSAIILSVILLLASCEEPEPVVVTFPDPNFEYQIRGIINKEVGDIAPEDLLEIIDISFINDSIYDISGIEYCTNLTEVALGGNFIADLSPLADLSKLSRFSAEGNRIRNLSPLSELTGLTRLVLAKNNIRDISPLSNLIKLTYLCLEENMVSDLTPLTYLTKVSTFRLMENSIVDIFPLVQNEGLSYGDNIYLGYNPLSDISLNTYIPLLEARGVNVNLIRN